LAGLTYDDVTSPINFRRLPISEGSDSDDRVSPKLGVSWRPRAGIVARGVYTESMGGVSFDESIRLEPTQLLGFNQSFRSIISESLVGPVERPDYRTYGFGVQFNQGAETYFDVEGEILESDVVRSSGTFVFDGTLPILPGSIQQILDYREERLTANVNHLVGEMVSIGARYSFIKSDLRQSIPDIPDSVSLVAEQQLRSSLHDIGVSGIVNHPSGVFARGELRWFIQNDSGSLLNVGDEDFAHINCFFGYRAPEQRWELTVGVLNLNDRNYRINPLNPFIELPRERSLFVRFNINL